MASTAASYTATRGRRIGAVAAAPMERRPGPRSFLAADPFMGEGVRNEEP